MLNLPKPPKKSTPKLAPGIHAGFDHCAPMANIARCKLWPVEEKQDETQADYSGVLWFVPEKTAARVFLWVHADKTLGLRVQLLKKPPRRKQPSNVTPTKDDHFEAAQRKLAELKKRKK